MKDKYLREMAKIAGFSRYNPGYLCRNGHESERYVSTSACIECVSQHNKKYAKENAGAIKERSLKYYKENRDVLLAYTKAYSKGWRAANKDRMRQYTKEWRLKNPEGQRAIDHRRRARKANATGSYDRSDLVRIMRLQKGRCVYCKTSVKDENHVDHIMPLVLGGTNGPENLQLLCPSCNVRKQAKHPITWAQEIGLLL